MKDAVLLASRPGQLPAFAGRAADRKLLDRLLQRLPADPRAISQLRRGWRELGMGISSFSLDDGQLAGLFRKKIASGQIDAVHLHDAPVPASDAPGEPVAGKVMHIRFPGGTVLVAGRGLLPPEYRKHANPERAAQAITQIGNGTPQSEMIDDQAHRLPGGTAGKTTGGFLRQHIVHQLKAGGLECAVLIEPAAIAQAAARPDAPVPIHKKTAPEKLQLALVRGLSSLEHLEGPAIAGILQRLAAIHKAGPGRQASDQALLYAAWTRIGARGIKALEGISKAASGVMAARDETQLQAAVRELADILHASGTNLLTAIGQRLDNGTASGTAKTGPATKKAAPAQTPKTAPPSAPVAKAAASAAAPPASAQKPPAAGKPSLEEVSKNYRVEDKSFWDLRPRGISGGRIQWITDREFNMLTKLIGGNAASDAAEAALFKAKSIFGMAGDETPPISQMEKFEGIAKEAQKSATKAYPIPKSWDKSANDWGNLGHNDAFRHTYWNARMTQEYGEEWTREFATAHEQLPGNDEYREVQDLYNNEVGRKIGREHPNATPEELAELVGQAVRNGDTIVVDKNQQIQWSNSVPVGEHYVEPPKPPQDSTESDDSS